MARKDALVPLRCDSKARRLIRHCRMLALLSGTMWNALYYLPLRMDLSRRSFVGHRHQACLEEVACVRSGTVGLHGDAVVVLVETAMVLLDFHMGIGSEVKGSLRGQVEVGVEDGLHTKGLDFCDGTGCTSSDPIGHWKAKIWRDCMTISR